MLTLLSGVFRLFPNVNMCSWAQKNKGEPGQK